MMLWRRKARFAALPCRKSRYLTSRVKSPGTASPGAVDDSVKNTYINLQEEDDDDG
jgi:hypothetical protein